MGQKKEINYEVDYAPIGKRIAYYRKSRKMTQAKLSEIIEASESYISKMENGRINIPFIRICQIADVLDVDISCLVSDGRRFADFDFQSEIEENIKDWSADERSILLDFIYFHNSKKKSN